MNVPLVTKVLFAVTAILTLALIVMAIVRGARAKKLGGRAVYAGTVAALVLALVIAVANGAIYKFNNIVSQYLSNVNVDAESLDEATAAAKDVSVRIEEEGIVLLENKDGSLPLPDGARVNVFGISSVALVYGGAGSGASDETGNVTLAEGLAQAGIEVNDELTQFYTERLPQKQDANIFNLQGGSYDIYEPAAADYPSSVISNAQSFSDTAIVVFSRSGGEGGDLPFDMAGYEGGDTGRHYLELQQVEQDMLSLVEESFEHVIVIINSSNAMELGFLDDERIDAAIWVGGPGATGCTAIGRVLAGDVNPSGRLADTYAYDAFEAPATKNAGDFTYTVDGEAAKAKYVDYAEGIYVGYRYYETRYADASGVIDEAAYAASVQYPFGYGLSYTTFDQKLVSHDEADGIVTVVIEVENTGDAAGKDVVQLYCTPPYTEGGIEKPQVELIAFGKTKLLAPGESQTIELTFSVEDLASFDYIDAGCYVLEAGAYRIRLMDNAHVEIDSFELAVDTTVTFGASNKRAADEVAAETLFSAAAGDVVYVSRADWEGTLPTERVGTKEAPADVIDEMDVDNINALYCSADPEADDILTGQSHGLSLEDMVGAEFDDPRWIELVEQMSLEDMGKLIGFGGFSTVAVPSVGKEATIDIDGPAGLNALTSDISGVQYPSGVVLASTFNVELIEEMGAIYAQEANAHGVNGVYAPACNIHRTPFSGRNFEYNSEDPLLSGRISAAEVRGITSGGICTYVKHFALNDQETNRSGVAVWSNEQAIRELYLRPFEIVVHEGGTTAIMTSYNRIGTVWAGGNQALITGVLRGEWGFEGVVITDYDNGGYMNVDQTLRAGGDLMLSTLGHAPSEITTDSAYGRSLMQQACIRILYMVVNSRAYTNPVSTAFPVWVAALAAADAVVLGLAGWMVFRKRKNDAA